MPPLGSGAYSRLYPTAFPSPLYASFDHSRIFDYIQLALEPTLTSLTTLPSSFLGSFDHSRLFDCPYFPLKPSLTSLTASTWLWSLLSPL